MSRKWITQVTIAVDQLANAVIAGSADETISARSYRMTTRPSPKKRWIIARKFIDWLFFWQEDHTYNAYVAEVERQHMRGAYQR
ncbi:MAG: hypothetical protein ACRBC3_19615 [Burkholderiaceae bacterium]